eukprot:2860536-Prymnesium_polylepis.1
MPDTRPPPPPRATARASGEPRHFDVPSGGLPRYDETGLARGAYWPPSPAVLQHLQPTATPLSGGAWRRG